MLGPQARTTLCGWWNQIVSAGWMRSTRLRAMRDSRSEKGRGPGYSRSRGPGRQPAAKFRLRSPPQWLARGAAPAGDRREASAAELARDVRDSDDPARASDAHKDPLIGGRPGHEQPCPVGRPGEVLERARPAEDDAGAEAHRAR